MKGLIYFFCFFFNDTATTEIYTLSLHDALPISSLKGLGSIYYAYPGRRGGLDLDRKSTRLNSSHRCISYAVFCLKKNTTDTIVLKGSLHVSLRTTAPPCLHLD